jgi:glycine oxidase
MLTVLPEDEESSAEAWCLQHQEPFLWLDEKGVQGLVPGYSGGHTRALWLPEVRQVRNPRLMQALLKDVLQRGIQIVDGQAVGEFQLEDGRVAFVSTPQGRFHADQFIICAGAWSGILSLDTGLEIPISPVRGQMLAYQVPEELLRPILQCNGRYLIPRREGVLLAGSTVENVGFDASTSLDAFSNLNAFALRSLPSLASCPVIGHWAGLRPGSPLGVPIIGLHPQLSNLWFNCGHFRNGLVMAPASAHLLKDLILGNPLSLDPSPYLPQSEVV